MNRLMYAGCVVCSIYGLGLRVASAEPLAQPPGTTRPTTTETADAFVPLSLEPANPHYLHFRGKPIVVISSGEHYGSVLNTEFDYIRYLDELKACGLNHTRLFTGTYHETPGAFGIANNTLAPQHGHYLCPWLPAHGSAADASDQYDLTQYDPAYFKRLTDFVSEASRRDIIVEVNLFSPNYDQGLWDVNPMNARNNINHIGECPRDESYTLKHLDLLDVQKQVTRQIVIALRSTDNIYFELCNEPYFGGVTQEWQDAIAAEIVNAEKDLPHKHLISMNIANGSKKIERPNKAVSIFNFHYAAPPDAVAENYGINKVIGENETGFKGSGDAFYRGEAWNFIVAGGGLFSNLDYSFTADHPDGALNHFSAPGGGGRALRKQLQTLRTFIESFEFIKMTPDADCIKGGLTSTTSGRVLSQSGRQYAIYLQGGKSAELQLNLPTGKYTARWISPGTGDVIKLETLSTSAELTRVRVPDYAEDIAVSLIAQ